VHARERRSRETRETRAAAREEKDSFFVPLPSRAISHARGHLRVSRFARRTTEKRETARSLNIVGTRKTGFALPFQCEQPSEKLSEDKVQRHIVSLIW